MGENLNIKFVLVIVACFWFHTFFTICEKYILSLFLHGLLFKIISKFY